MPSDSGSAHAESSTTPDWQTCSHQGEKSCNGIRLDGHAHCLAHLNSVERTTWVERITSGSPLDLRGTELTGDLLDRLLKQAFSPEGTRRIKAIDLEDCKLRGTISFRNVEFCGRANFKGITFIEGADFTGTRFSHEANFAKAVFARGNAQFEGAVFEGESNFFGTRFCHEGRFARASFTEDALFINARFDKESFFSRAVFSGDAGFNRATFGMSAGFTAAVFTRGAWFNEARFTSVADFSKAVFTTAKKLGPLSAGSVELDGASFTERVVLDLEADYVTTQDARFSGGIELRARRAELLLRRTSFGATSSVSGTVGEPGGQRAGVLSLQESDVSQLTLTDVDLRWCRFAGAHQLDKLRLEGETPFNRPPRGWRVGMAWFPLWHWTRRRALAEEHTWRLGTHKARGWAVGVPERGEPQQPVGPERLAALYRGLRKALEDGKNEAGAGDFYYGEMEARRHSPSTGRGERFVLGAYWALSGYGQRAGRALVALVLLLCGLFTGLVQHGLPDQTPTTTITTTTHAPQSTAVELPASAPPPERRWTAERVEKAARVALGSALFRDTDQKLTTAGSWMLLTGRALGPLLLALAALAVRARVKR